jgi:hypothetical protein
MAGFTSTASTTIVNFLTNCSKIFFKKSLTLPGELATYIKNVNEKISTAKAFVLLLTFFFEPALLI